MTRPTTDACRRRRADAAAGGCISVSPPDKPIEINLNVTIQQEVLVGCSGTSSS